MNWFRNLPVRHKLTGIIFLVSSLVLALTALAFLLAQVRQLDNESERDLRAVGDMIAAASRFPLTFRDSLDAEEILASLRAQQDIVSGYLFEPSQVLMAAYFRSSWQKHPVAPGNELAAMKLETRQIEEAFRTGRKQQWQEQGFLSVFQPVEAEGHLIGYLYLRSEMTNLRQQYLWLVFSTLLVAGGAATLALLLGARLQRMISEPVSRLAERMRRVASDRKLGTAAVPPDSEEFGMLFQGLEEMLEVLRQRDQQLQEHSELLESEVLERTWELIAAKEAAEAASASKSRFLANMSHEIRTPMIGVLGMADLLRNEALTDQQRQMAETVYTSGEALLEILNDLLDIAKIEAGKLTLETGPFKLCQVVDSAVSLFAETARSKGLHLVFESEPGLPDLVSGDAGRLRQIVLNLVGNAVKFTRHGQVTVTLSADPAVLSNDRLFHIAVRDTGIGIPAESLARIFEAFDQADGTLSRTHGGTGLGLTIVRELTKLMGGSVAVESTPGVGSCFTVTLQLPLAVEALLAGQVLPETPRRADVTPTLAPARHSRKSILLAEDNPTTQELLGILLRNAGFVLTIVDDGHGVLEKIAAAHFDLIFMDCQMPHLDGLETSRRLRQAGVVTPIVALTAHVRQEDEERCLAAGMNDFLGKPFRQHELQAVLSRWLPVADPAALPAD